MKRPDQGLVTLEFAMVSAVFLLLFFTVLEMGRLLFVWNSLAEATRRGARIAIVCPPSHPSVIDVTLFNAPGNHASNSSLINGLSRNMVSVDYPVIYGTPMVRVAISGYIHTLLLPLPEAYRMLEAPGFVTILPSESMGALPDPSGGTGTNECP